MVEEGLRAARRKGVPTHRHGEFLRRRLGTVYVEGRHRTTRPCLACCDVLSRYGLVICYRVDDEVTKKRADLITDPQLKASDRMRWRATKQ